MELHGVASTSRKILNIVRRDYCNIDAKMRGKYLSPETVSATLSDVAAGYTPMQIERRTGVREQYVRYHANKWNLYARTKPGRPNIPKEQQQQIFDAYGRMTAQETADLVGVNEGTVLRYWRRAGLTRSKAKRPVRVSLDLLLDGAFFPIVKPTEAVSVYQIQERLEHIVKKPVNPVDLREKVSLLVGLGLLRKVVADGEERYRTSPQLRAQLQEA